MADWRRALSEDEIPAAFRNVYGDRTEKPLSVKGAEIGVEFTPAGTIFGLNDIKNELQKENPDYYKIGMMAGVEAIGLIPGLDKVAIEAIRAGAKKVGLDKVADQTDVLLSKPKAEDSIKTEIIAGPGAKSYSNASLLRAERLRAAGASPTQIETETGRVRTGTPEDYLDNEGKTLEDLSPEYKNLVGIRDHLQGLIKQISTENSSSATSEIARYERELSEINKRIAKIEKANPADESGIVVKPANPFKFEIDDSRIEIKNSDGNQTLKEATKHYPMIVRNIIPTHTELFEEYPNLEYLEFYVDPSLGSGAHFDPTVSRQGAIVVGPDKQSLGSPNSKKFRNTFFHELQHAVQYQDYKIAGLEQLSGNPVGYGRISVQPDRFYKGREQLKLLENNPNLIKLRDEILEIFESQKGTGALDATSPGFTFPGVSPNPAKVFGDVEVAKKIARKMRELESELFKTYMRTASETEARLAGRRAQDIATVGSGPKPKITSDLAKERRIETLEEFSSDTPKSDVDKKKEDIKIKLGSMTNEEVLRYATGAINFARYATGIDKKLVGFSAFGPTKTNYAPSEDIGFTPQALGSVNRQNPRVEPEVEAAFTELADIQRGQPELAMVEAQMLYGGGVMPYALEHAGDLTHRMAERGGRYGQEFVQPKVTRLLDSLLSEYGFEKEMLENIQSNARFKYERDKPDISFEEYKKDYEQSIDKALNKYSEAHKKVPVYNQMQLAGREAAIAIGEKRYTDAIEHLYTIDQAIKDGTYNQIALEFDPNIDFRKRKEFAEGGAVGDMNRQMELFARGGLKDDGMNMDPVSGNEVPSGSLAEEVRDDIPAQLSEGEYVVPADVVRYYGVKHFEDLRNKAKKGLTQMEADGRIGGEPVMDEDITEEDIAAFERMLAIGAAEGGLMDKMAKAVKSNKMINDRANAKGLRVGYAAGGMTKATYDNPTRIDQVIDRVMGAARKDPNIMQELTKRGIEVSRTTPQMNPQEMDKANPMPETRKAFFQGGVTGLPMAPSQQLGGITPGMSQDEIYKYITTPTTIDPMYSVPGGSYIGAGAPVAPSAPAPEATTPAASPEYCASLGMMFDAEKNMCVPRPTSSDDGPDIPVAGDGKPAFQDWGKELNFTDYESMEEWAKGLSQPMKGGKLAKVAAAAMPGPLGLIAGVAPSVDALQDISDLNAARIIAQARGDKKMADMLEGYIEDRIKTSSGLVDMLDELVASGKQKADAYAKRFNFDSMEDVMSIESNRNKFTNFTTQYGTNMTFKPATESPGLSGDTEASRRERDKDTQVMQQTASPAAGGSGSLVTGSYTGNNNNDDGGPSHQEIMAMHDKIRQEAKDFASKSEEEKKEQYESVGGGFADIMAGKARGGLMQKRK